MRSSRRGFFRFLGIGAAAATMPRVALRAPAADADFEMYREKPTDEPIFSFSSDTNSGIYYAADGYVRIAVAGQDYAIPVWT